MLVFSPLRVNSNGPPEIAGLISSFSIQLSSRDIAEVQRRYFAAASSRNYNYKICRSLKYNLILLAAPSFSRANQFENLAPMSGG